MMIINIVKIYSLIVIFTVGFERLIAQATFNDMEISYSNSLDSKYISEGRCNLTSGGLSSFNTDISFHWFNVNMWYGTGLDTDYRELQFSVGASFDLFDIGINFGLTDLSFLHDDSKDQEFYTELSYNKFNWLTPTLVNVYSFEADGSFLELLLEFNIPFQNKRFGLTPFLLEGFDLGFVEDTVCLNNFQIGFEFSYQLIDNVSITSYIASSLGVWEKASKENYTWGGISISTDF